MSELLSEYVSCCYIMLHIIIVISLSTTTCGGYKENKRRHARCVVCERYNVLYISRRWFNGL